MLSREISEKIIAKNFLILSSAEWCKRFFLAILLFNYFLLFPETLRKHPPIPTFPRRCNKAYQVPGTKLVLEPGTLVEIPVQAIHRDPEYYPEPEKFDPERFSPENRAKRPQYTFLTFGDGPRYCIGKCLWRPWKDWTWH